MILVQWTSLSSDFGPLDFDIATGKNEVLCYHRTDIANYHTFLLNMQQQENSCAEIAKQSTPRPAKAPSPNAIGDGTVYSDVMTVKEKKCIGKYNKAIVKLSLSHQFTQNN